MSSISPPRRGASPADTIPDSGFDAPIPAVKHHRGTSRPEKPQLDRPSIYVFAKTPQIKKPDGVPLYRKDIQFALLSYIFNNDQAVFTSSYDSASPKMTFADLYIESMSRSSKCSRVVREKLLSDKDLAVSVAMVSLLVNVGKMNTTLTFFPEMRAQLRTYHPIPSLQSGQEQNAKLLQDAPRIKSILKGVQEDRNEPFTWEQLLECRKRGLIPLTSPVSLIFLFGTYCQKMTELHFPPPREFYDLFNKTSFSSKSRATAFLWLLWHYLETDGSAEAASKNPFGRPEQDGTVRIPKLQHITPEQEVTENADPEEEIEYGVRMEQERKRYLESEQTARENPTGDKPVKKARGGVASRKAKANSIALSVARLKGTKEKDVPSSSVMEEESPTLPATTSTKAGDISFVLNTSSSPGTSPRTAKSQQTPQAKPERSSNANAPPSFVPKDEPAHNLRARTGKKRKIHDYYMFDDYAALDQWEEPDEAGYSEEEVRRELVEKEIRRRIKREAKKRRRERFKVGALAREWAFMQSKLTSVLHEADRLEIASANDSEGGEECEAILTAIRRAKRRGARRAAKLLEAQKNHEDVEMGEVEDDKSLPNFKLTLNGH